MWHVWGSHLGQRVGVGMVVVKKCFLVRASPEVIPSGFVALSCFKRCLQDPMFNIRAFSPCWNTHPNTIWPFGVLISFSYDVLFNWRYRLQFQLHFLRKTHRIQFRRNAESGFIESQICHPSSHSHTEVPSRMPGVGGIYKSFREKQHQGNWEAAASQEQLVLSQQVRLIM